MSEIRALAQHGSPKSIETITDDLFSVREREAVTARILSLSGIRHDDSVHALFDIMKSAGRGKVQPYMDEFRISLMVLTGVDQGQSQDAWNTWWNKNKKTFKVATKQPLLPESVQRRFDNFWGNRRKYQRNKKRGDRGQDPENDN